MINTNPISILNDVRNCNTMGVKNKAGADLSASGSFEITPVLAEFLLLNL